MTNRYIDKATVPLSKKQTMTHLAIFANIGAILTVRH